MRNSCYPGPKQRAFPDELHRPGHAAVLRGDPERLRQAYIDGDPFKSRLRQPPNNDKLALLIEELDNEFRTAHDFAQSNFGETPKLFTADEQPVQ